MSSTVYLLHFESCIKISEKFSAEIENENQGPDGELFNDA